MECPEKLARPGVVAAYVLGRRFLDHAAIAGSGGVAGDDHDVADDQRSGAVVEAAGQRLGVVEVQTGAAVIAEIRVRLAGPGIEGVEILAANGEDALIAAAAPGVDAARALTLQLFFGAGERLLLPNQLTRTGIEGTDEAVHVLRVQHAVDHDRRGAQIGVDAQLRKRFLERGSHRRAPPHDAQILDRVLVDLIRWRVAGKGLVAAEIAPVDGLPLRLDAKAAADPRERDRDNGDECFEAPHDSSFWPFSLCPLCPS